MSFNEADCDQVGHDICNEIPHPFPTHLQVDLPSNIRSYAIMGVQLHILKATPRKLIQTITIALKNRHQLPLY